ncbi:MAG: hypothetical protein ACKVH8_00775 [Pirellulales bacterium]
MHLAKHVAIVSGLTFLGFLIPVYPTLQQAGLNQSLKRYQMNQQEIQNLLMIESQQVLQESRSLFSELNNEAPKRWSQVIALHVGAMLRSENGLLGQAIRWSLIMGGAYLLIQSGLWLFGLMVHRGLIANLLILGGAGAFLSNIHLSAGLLALAVGAVLKLGQAIDTWTSSTNKEQRMNSF